MFWLLGAAHGKNIIGDTLFSLPFPGPEKAREMLYLL